MTADNLSQRVSELSQRLEELKAKCASNPANALKILSDALESLQASIEELSAADEEPIQQSEELLVAQETSRDIEERYRAFIALSSEGIWRLESDQPMPISMPEGDQIEFILEHAYFAECNDACARMYGLTSAEELIGVRMTDLLPRSNPTNIEVIRAFIRSGYSLSEKETQEIDKEGNTHYITNNVTGIVENNCLVRVWGMQRDITERKRAEKALRESEKRMNKAQEIAHLGGWELDLLNNNLSWSDEVYRIFGLQPQEFGATYEAFLDAVHPDDRAAVDAAYFGSLREGRDTYEIEHRIVRKSNGEVRIVHEKCEHIRDRSGRITRSVGMVHDITERKKAEEELQKARDELELRVLERTAELKQANGKLEIINMRLIDEIKWHANTEAELLKAKDAAEEAVRAKAAFLANMSHEIRTPMNAVIGMTDLMLEDPLTPEQKDNLELIRNNGDALLNIINDILDFSKIESDKLVLEEQPFILRQSIEEALDLVALRAGEKSLNLAYTLDKNVSDTIIGDPGRLRQVLVNLLSNAVKFTDKGEVTLSVLGQRIDDTDEIHFAVRDTGIGIPHDRMNLLFQPFNQMEPSTTRIYGGTGLGLAISKNLVELMGGKIWAESEVGKGSTFHFTIKAAGKSEAQPISISPILVDKHMLIVSENKTNRQTLSKQAFNWGMIPLIASSGQEALKHIHRGVDFDIAILDMDMQDISSMELEEEIRKYNKTLPLVLLTSFGKRIPPNHAYLTKPIKTSQLHNVLTEILGGQPAKKVARMAAVGRPVQSKPLRILLAEDNVSSQKVVLQMLKKLGYKADIAANGIEALQALERQHYDVVLMDIKMPEMDGFEATKQIRQRWPNNGPKVIAITAYALEGDKEKCLEAGMDDYISKPVKINDLADTLNKYPSQE